MDNERQKIYQLWSAHVGMSEEELEKELPITLERIRQIIVSGNNKKFDIKYKHPELR